MKRLRELSQKDLIQDALTGVIISLLSVPLAMGYATVAGLPPQYGLYGSLAPILIFGLITSSTRFVFGVDAAPAALIASLLPSLGIARGSAGAVAVMPAFTLLTALWLMLFWLLRAGRFAKLVSESVLGGCVSGIACILILSLIPQMFGGSMGTGRAPSLVRHMVSELSVFHPLSFCLGVVTVAAILLGRTRTRASVSVIMMSLGIGLNLLLGLDRYGVAMVGSIPAGMPRLVSIDFTHFSGHMESVLVGSLAVALVIAAETLVSSRTMARKYGEEIDNQQELLAYALSNIAAAMFGSSPVTGSVSRTNRANRRGVKSQLTSVFAAATMALFLLYATPLLSYLPIPVMTGILIASLFTLVEFSTAAELLRVNRSEFMIFAAALAAELLGLAEGVIVGVVLSFGAFTMRATDQPSYFLGRLPGREGFFDLNRMPIARPIKHTLLYQFNGPLFYATIDGFERDILGAIRPDTKLVVVTGISSVGFYAAERLLQFYRKLGRRGIRMFLAGHASAVNENLIDYGAEDLIHVGAVRQRLTEALAAGGLKPPYPTEPFPTDLTELAPEAFTWAYGKHAVPRLDRLAEQLAQEILSGGELDTERLKQSERELAGDYWSEGNEEEFLGLLEMRLAAIAAKSPGNEETFRVLSRSLLERRIRLERALFQKESKDAALAFILVRLRQEADFLNRYPEAADLLRLERNDYMAQLRKEDPELSGLIDEAEAILDNTPRI